MSEQVLSGYPSIDKPWMKYYSEELRNRPLPQCTIYKNIHERNKDYPDDVAILFYGNKITYKNLFDKVDKCAKALKHIGIKKGDCVTLCSAGVPEAIYIVLACSRIGAIANFINPMFSTQQMIDRINDTEAKWTFILDEMYEYIEQALPSTCIENVVIIPVTNSMQPLISRILYYKSKAKKIIGENQKNLQKYISWNVFLKEGALFIGNVDTDYEKDTPTVMVYSSGTTGASKGILLTNDGINCTLMFYINPAFPYKRGDCFLQMIPVWFSTGIVLSVLMPLIRGNTVIPVLKFCKESFLKGMKEHRPSMTLTASSLWRFLIEEGKDIDCKNMEYPISGGEKLLPYDEKRINQFLREHKGPSNLVKGYGMCELGGTVSSSPALGVGGKYGSAGFPILHVTVAAFNPYTNEELKYNEHGELRVHSLAAMKGYYKNPEATNDFFWTDKNGLVWGCTGDIGYIDEDGEVFVLGRATDSTVLDNGKVVYLFDIEEIILKNDNISQCKVIDIDEEGIKQLVAHIVLRNSSIDSALILHKIDDVLRSTLPSDEIPSYYKIRESMPISNNGKRNIEALRNDKDQLIIVS